MSQLVTFIIYIFSLETFVYSQLNAAIKSKDESIVETLGPYAWVFNQILEVAPSKRYDIDLDRFSKGVVLYRGTGLKDTQIKEFVSRVPVSNICKIEDLKKIAGSKSKVNRQQSKARLVKTAKFSIIGYISTSLNREYAESFSFTDQDNGKIATLFKINFKSSDGYYLMNNGAYPEEQEVVLTDGFQF